MKCLFYGMVGLALVLSLGGCGSGGSGTSSAGSYTYSTTSSKGDYAEWTLSGDQLAAAWNVIQTDGTIAYTLDFTSTCGTADTFGVHTCTVDAATSTCSDGALTCPGTFTGDFAMMEVPGVALFVQTGSGSSGQLNVGFAKDSGACTQDVSGDYTTIHTGLGTTENFGLYRVDSDLLNVTHGDFGFVTADGNATQSVDYGTSTPDVTFSDSGCVGGVRTRVLAGSGDTIRSMMTASGLSVWDLPAGLGGLISFKTASSSLTANIKALATPATATSPAYPDFTVAPSGYTSTNTVLAPDYSAPAAIPGLFKLDGALTDTGRVIMAAMKFNGKVIPGLFKLDGALTDTGRVVMAAMKFNGKVIAVGMVYNYRTMYEINPATGTTFPSDGLYNTGNYILFEK
ncbi:MAG: hypothetical protein P8164_16135 [Gammaproteobacteria bacterium]